MRGELLAAMRIRTDERSAIMEIIGPHYSKLSAKELAQALAEKGYVNWFGVSKAMQREIAAMVRDELSRMAAGLRQP
jgi:hypothetical protein